MSDIIKVINSSMTGAPVLGGANGTLVTLLDAVLKDGFNLKSIDQITFSNGIATAVVSAGHGYVVNTIVLLAGANQAEYNGEKKILSATTTTFTFAVSGSPTSPATGTITAKVAPLGWTKPFSATNKAAYQSPNLNSDRHYLRVDDGQTSSPQQARVWMAETMSTIDSGGGITPTRNGSYPTTFDPYCTWPKGSSGSSTNVDWVIVGNDKTFYFVPMWYGSPFQREICGFGHFNSFVPGDQFRTFLMGIHGSNSAGINSPSWPGQYCEGGFFNYFSSTPGQFVIRGYSGSPSQAYFHKATLAAKSGSFSSGNDTGLMFPNPADMASIIVPTYLMDSLVDGFNVAVRSLRGVVPGIMAILGNSAYADNLRVVGTFDDPTKEFLVLNLGYSANSQYRVAFDLSAW